MGLRCGWAPALDTLTFALELLKRIPRSRRISTTELCEQLRDSGWDRNVRTVQRQLDELCRHFDIERDDRSKPYGYQWKANSSGLSILGLTEKESLVLALAQQHLRTLLPPAVMASMDPFFEQANARLAAHPHHASRDRAASHWLRKVRLVSSSQPLLVPEIDATVLDAVSSALWHDEWLDVTYRNSARKTSRGQVMPLGLAQQGERLYLVCRFPGTRTTGLWRFTASWPRQGAACALNVLRDSTSKPTTAKDGSHSATERWSIWSSLSPRPRACTCWSRVCARTSATTTKGISIGSTRAFPQPSG